MSLMFWIFMAAGSLALLVFAFWPLIRIRASAGHEPAQAALIRHRLAELEYEYGKNLIDEATWHRERSRLDKELPAVVDAQPHRESATPGRLLLLLLPLIASVAGLLLYNRTGAIDEIEAWQQAREELAPLTLTELDGLARSGKLKVANWLLEKRSRLHEQPASASGWQDLGNSYLELRRPVEALKAFSRAARLAPGDTGIRIGMSKALIGRQQPGDQQQAQNILEGILAAQPDHEGALLLSSYNLVNMGKLEKARAGFEKLLTGRTPGSAVAKMLEEQIARLQPANPDAPRIELQVRAPEQALESLPGSARVFVIAREPDSVGPPVAVKAVALQDLNSILVLDDSNLMLPGDSIGKRQELELVVRISRRGDAQPRPGDLYGQALWQPHPQASGPVSVVIDQEVD